MSIIKKTTILFISMVLLCFTACSKVTDGIIIDKIYRAEYEYLKSVRPMMYETVPEGWFFKIYGVDTNSEEGFDGFTIYEVSEEDYNKYKAGDRVNVFEHTDWEYNIDSFVEGGESEDSIELEEAQRLFKESSTTEPITSVTTQQATTTTQVTTQKSERSDKKMIDNDWLRVKDLKEMLENEPDDALVMITSECMPGQALGVVPYCYDTQFGDGVFVLSQDTSKSIPIDDSGY